MARIDKGNELTGYTLQPGWTVVKHEDGLIESECVFKVRTVADGWVNPRKGVDHPRIPYLSLVTEIVTHDEGGIATVRSRFAGIDSEVTDGYCTVLAAVSQQPIETHPRFESHIAGTAASPLNGARFDAVTKHFDGFPSVTAAINSNLVGVTSYLGTGFTVRTIQYATQVGADAVNFDRLGKTYATVPGFGQYTKPPNARFLCTSNTFEKIGKNLHKITSEYMMDAGGWNSLIYTAG